MEPATLKAVAIVAGGAVALRALSRTRGPDNRIELSPDTRPEFAPASVAPLKGFDLFACLGVGGAFDVLASAGVVGKYVDRELVPYSYNAALTVQGVILGAEHGHLPRLLCNSVTCLEFAGGDTPAMPGDCAARVAAQWIKLVDAARLRPEIADREGELTGKEATALGGVMTLVLSAFSNEPPLTELEALQHVLRLKATDVQALTGTALRRRVQEIWALCSRIATRLDAAFNLRGHERLSLTSEVADSAKTIAADTALAGATVGAKLARGALGAAASAFISEFGAFVVVGGLSFILVRRALK